MTSSLQKKILYMVFLDEVLRFCVQNVENLHFLAVKDPPPPLAEASVKNVMRMGWPIHCNDKGVASITLYYLSTFFHKTCLLQLVTEYRHIMY